jgi:hypothetical protein
MVAGGEVVDIEEQGGLVELLKVVVGLEVHE